MLRTETRAAHYYPAPPPQSATQLPPDQGDNGEKKPMKLQLNRRRSYINWPSQAVTPDELAEEGFFYTQKLDVVKCAFCGLELGKWEAGDIPSVDHRTWSPHCPLVARQECGNVRMSDNERSSFSSASSTDDQNQDTCGKYGIHVRQKSGPENGRPVDIQRYAVKHNTAHPQYALLEDRLTTFRDWPVSIKQRPVQLAEAGFYYSGKSDQTICYSCGGGLKAWEETDEPWEQHASWFPMCSYLRLHKSPEFIALHNKTADEKGRLPAAPGTSSAAGAARPPIPSLNSTQAVATATTTTAPVTTEASAAPATKDNPSSNQPVNLCKICYTREIGVVFLPCGHMVACVECAPALSKCAVCRRELEATVRAFLS